MRRTAVALVLLLGILAAADTWSKPPEGKGIPESSPSQVGQNNNAPDANGHPPQNAAPLPKLPDSNGLNAHSQQRATDESERLAIVETAAQTKRLADSTENLAGWTRFLVIVGFGTLIALIVQLSIFWQTVKDTGTAANAAVKGANAAMLQAKTLAAIEAPVVFLAEINLQGWHKPVSGIPAKLIEAGVPLSCAE